MQFLFLMLWTAFRKSSWVYLSVFFFFVHCYEHFIYTLKKEVGIFLKLVRLISKNSIMTLTFFPYNCNNDLRNYLLLILLTSCYVHICITLVTLRTFSDCKRDLYIFCFISSLIEHSFCISLCIIHVRLNDLF